MSRGIETFLFCAIPYTNAANANKEPVSYLILARMKNRILLAFFACFVAVAAMAQDPVTTPPTSETEGAEEKLEDKLKLPKGGKRAEQLLIDINWDQLTGLPDSVNVDPLSRGGGVYSMFDLPLNNSKHFSFGVGVGITSHGYTLDAQVGQTTDSVGAVSSKFFPIADDRNVETYKLSVNYIDLPAEIRWRSKLNDRGHQWKVTLGARLGYRLQVHDKIVEDGLKAKTYDFPNVRKWRYGGVFRVGYGKVMLSSFYSVSTLFEDNTGPEVNAFSVGITLAPF